MCASLNSTQYFNLKSGNQENPAGPPLACAPFFRNENTCRRVEGCGQRVLISLPDFLISDFK